MELLAVPEIGRRKIRAQFDRSQKIRLGRRNVYFEPQRDETPGGIGFAHGRVEFQRAFDRRPGVGNDVVVAARAVEMQQVDGVRQRRIRRGVVGVEDDRGLEMLARRRQIVDAPRPEPVPAQQVGVVGLDAVGAMPIANDQRLAEQLEP